jgi:hypothetical protein
VRSTVYVASARALWAHYPKSTRADDDTDEHFCTVVVEIKLIIVFNYITMLRHDLLFWGYFNLIVNEGWVWWILWCVFALFNARPFFNAIKIILHSKYLGGFRGSNFIPSTWTYWWNYTSAVVGQNVKIKTKHFLLWNTKKK